MTKRSRSLGAVPSERFSTPTVRWTSGCPASSVSRSNVTLNVSGSPLPSAANESWPFSRAGSSSRNERSEWRWYLVYCVRSSGQERSGRLMNVASAAVELKPGLPLRTRTLTAGTPSAAFGPLSQPRSSSPLSHASRTASGKVARRQLDELKGEAYAEGESERARRRTRGLQLDVVRQVEGQVVPAADEPEPLVRRTRLEVAHDVAAQVKRVAAEVGDRQDRDLDVAEVVGAAGVVRLVEEAVLLVVDRLVAAKLGELIGRDDALEALGACAQRDGRQLALERRSRKTDVPIGSPVSDLGPAGSKEVQERDVRQRGGSRRVAEGGEGGKREGKRLTPPTNRLLAIAVLHRHDLVVPPLFRGARSKHQCLLEPQEEEKLDAQSERTGWRGCRPGERDHDSSRSCLLLECILHVSTERPSC